MSSKCGHNKSTALAPLMLWVLLLLLLPVVIIPVSSLADMADPTRPMFLRKKPVSVPKKRAVSHVSSPTAPREVYTLTSTLVSKQRTVAVINNHVVAVGDRVGSATVVAIESSRVKLRMGGRDITLVLTTQGVRKTVRGYAVSNQQRLP